LAIRHQGAGGDLVVDECEDPEGQADAGDAAGRSRDDPRGGLGVLGYRGLRRDIAG